MKKILVTGSSGFIGFHVSKLLLDKGNSVLGIDSMNNYYDVNLKIKRNELLQKNKNFEFNKLNMTDFNKLNESIKIFEPDYIIHLAAQAGVRHSIEHPEDYVESNLVSTFNLLEISKNLQLEHLMIASTSSAYGASKNMPFLENDPSNEPLTFYAATKKACESISHSYSYLFSLPITCFRFFTVYGPYGRPDMALFKFVKAITSDREIDVYNNGDMVRDFTYVDDLSNAISLLLEKTPVVNKKINANDSISSVAPWRLINIGNSDPIKLIDFVREIENCLNKKAKINFMPIQIGDVKETFANTQLLQDLTSYKPMTDYKKGIKKFVDWYQEHYKDK